MAQKIFTPLSDEKDSAVVREGGVIITIEYPDRFEGQVQAHREPITGIMKETAEKLNVIIYGA